VTAALAALDGVVERHGRAVLTDPLALAAALRGAPDPLPEADVAALVAVAGSGAVDRMRAVLEGGGDAAAAHAAASEAARSAGPRAAWACAELGAALGLLPRSMAVASGPDAEPTRPISPPPHRRRPLVAVVAVLALLVVVAAGAFVLGRGTRPDPVPQTPVATPEPSLVQAAPATSAPPPAPPEALAAFTDPDLLAAAQPYLTQPGTACRADTPGLNQAESVSCVLGGSAPGGSVLGIFKKMLTPDAVAELRRSFQRGDAGAKPGSVRSLRWESVPGQPGVRVGVAGGRPGEGTRVRFLDAETGYARLYFDVDATGVAVFLGTQSPDQTLLRAYWADPDA
jgi:hypothetical protein